jgi:hypothetical protein
MELSRNETKQRGVAPRARRLLVGVVAVFFAAATPAWSAQVVDVRVGKHAGFSRVVFELDSPVGYKVERNAPAAGISELVISLDAASVGETVSKDLDFIESVEIVPGGGNHSTVRVRLKGDDLKLKEMILANPPRIVLDVLSESAMAAAKAKAAEEKAARQASKKAAKEEAARLAAEKEEAEQREAEIALALEEAQANEELAMNAPQPPASMPAGGLGAKPGNAPAAKLTAPAARPAPAAAMPSAVIPKPPSAPPAARPAPKPSATARPKPAPTKPAAVAPVGKSDGLFTTTNLAIAGVGLLALAGAGFVFMRRRGGAEVVDASAFENPLGDDNPFAGLDPEVSDGEVEAETEELPISEAARAEVGIPIPENEDEAPTTDSQEGSDMDMATDNAQTTIMDSPPMGGMAGGDDVSRMVAEFERRMAAMEARVDELVDAKERLERQVAAQTEELRVQRAAIARTQRAVRNLGRPGEDAPTEPALRDPSRPEGPRE